MDPQVFRFFLAGLLLKSYNRSNVHEKDAEKYAIHHQKNRRLFHADQARRPSRHRKNWETVHRAGPFPCCPQRQNVNVLYNIVDRIYIGRIPDVGSLALTGVGVTFPIITIISAFAGICKRRRRPPCCNRTRTEKPGTCRKDPRKFYFPAALFFRASDGIFLCLSDTASVSLRRK